MTRPYYDFPAEHWHHLRTSNAIESSFSTVKLRTRVTKDAGSKKGAPVELWVKVSAGDDDDARAAQVDERDERCGGVEAEAAVADQSDAAVEAFEPSVV
jgi:hypothetical protein